jgi:organic radical activating enzyme
MPNTVTGGSPEIREEIEHALQVLKKDKYKAKVSDDGGSGELSIRFEFGATDQTLKFKKDEWRKKGAVEKKIIDDLDI